MWTMILGTVDEDLVDTEIIIQGGQQALYKLVQVRRHRHRLNPEGTPTTLLAPKWMKDIAYLCKVLDS